MVKAIKGPIPQANIMPTGGVDVNNVADWIKAVHDALHRLATSRKQRVSRHGGVCRHPCEPELEPDYDEDFEFNEDDFDFDLNEDGFLENPDADVVFPAPACFAVT